MGQDVIETVSCRACGSEHTERVIDLGLQPLANNLLREEDLAREEPKFPLAVRVCTSCWLLQIEALVPPVDLFSEYLYFSSFSDTMLRHAREAALRYVRELALGPSSHVIEIASNDGYLLKNFSEAGVPCLGIEPAANIATVARSAGIDTRVEFFGLACADRLVKEGRAADLVLGNNVFAHAPDTNDFVAGLERVLRPGGQIVLEFPYAVDFLEHVEFDTVYHEHVFYFALTPLVPLLARHGLEVVDVERIAIHGGSLRLFAARRGEHAVRPSVPATLAEEEALGLRSMAPYHRFAEGVERIKRDLLALLASLRSEGKRVAAYGASAKGSTLLNYVDPPSGSIEFIADRSTHKQGRRSPGLHLPIIGPTALVERMPDATLLLTWNFASEILAQQAEYRARGGRFILPVPRVEIV
jgi:SAM-dependent methyltransferase